jgi:hypothetical protein
MDFSDLKEDKEIFPIGQSYAHTTRTALISLLLGGGCLGIARLLGLSGSSWPIARIAEFIGWGALVSSSVSLAALHSRFDRKLVRWNWTDKYTPATGQDAKREEAIDRLYSELRPLMSRAATDPSLREEAQSKLSLLRKLQDEEADEIQKRFEAGLLLKPGEGRRALERAREILARYEDPSSTHAATQQNN